MQPNQLSIIVVGGMNPSIHHPYWYEHIGGFRKEETTQSLENTLVSPQITKLQTSTFEIQCMSDRWSIQTTHQDSFQRILELTILVFTRLNETNLVSYGINFDFNRPPLKTLFGSRIENYSTLQMTISRGVPDQTTTIGNLLVKRKYTMFLEADRKVRFNAHHELVSVGVNYTTFDFEPILRESYAATQDACFKDITLVISKGN